MDVDRELDTLRTEIRLIREQTAEDFGWTTKALGELNVRVEAGFDVLAKTLAQLQVDFAETTRQLQGRMRLMEGRFDRMLQAGDSSLGLLGAESRNRWDALERRV